MKYQIRTGFISLLGIDDGWNKQCFEHLRKPAKDASAGPSAIFRPAPLSIERSA